jgi:hypothetical protein
VTLLRAMGDWGGAARRPTRPALGCTTTNMGGCGICQPRRHPAPTPRPPLLRIAPGCPALEQPESSPRPSDAPSTRPTAPLRASPHSDPIPTLAPRNHPSP